MTVRSEEHRSLEAAADVRRTEIRRPLRPYEPAVVTSSPPVLASVAAHPSWLLLAAATGALAGVLLASVTGFTATAVLQVSNTGEDSTRVRQVGQTVQRLVTSAAVVQDAAAAVGTSPEALADSVSAQWQQDTDLVTVTASASDAEAAADTANALALAAVDANKASVQQQLDDLRRDANLLLTRERLDDQAAEAARLGQLGSSLASRQDAVSAQTNGLFVADAATSAAPAGLDRMTGGIAGLLGGLLLGALAAVVAGLRGVRVGSAAQVRSLLPGVEVSTPEQAPELAGRVVEAGTTCLAIVSLPGAQEASVTFAMDVADFLRSHGRTVTLVDLASLPSTESRRDVLRHDARTDVPGAFGTDVVVFVLEAQEAAFGMLVGQSGLRAAVIGRRRVTRLRTLSDVLTQLARARPVVVLPR